MLCSQIQMRVLISATYYGCLKFIIAFEHRRKYNFEQEIYTEK